jgi:hypothetical protein
VLHTLDVVMLFDQRHANRGVTATVTANGRFRESGDRPFGKQRAQATAGCQRRQEVRPERAQRSARAQHRTPGPAGDAINFVELLEDHRQMNEPHYFVPHPSVQFARSKRYVQRLRDGYNGREFTRNGESQEWEDDMYSTFIHIHHIKDWFSTSTLKKDAEQYAKKTEDLARCSWIANLWKHSRTDRNVPARIGRLPSHIRYTATNIPAMDRPPNVRFPFVFEFKDGRVEQFESIDLAERGLKAWEDFIANAVASGRMAPPG